MTGVGVVVGDRMQPQCWEKEDSLAEQTVNYKNPDGLLYLSDGICLEIWCHQLWKCRKRHVPFARRCEQMHADSPSVAVRQRWTKVSLCLNFRKEGAVNRSWFAEDRDERRWSELGWDQLLRCEMPLHLPQCFAPPRCLIKAVRSSILWTRKSKYINM